MEIGSVPKGANNAVDGEQPRAPSTFRAQLHALTIQVDRVRTAIPHLVDLNEQLHERVGDSFSERLSALDRELDKLEQKSAAGCPGDELWQSLNRERRKASGLFEDALAFIQGALVRNLGFDDGVCAIADRLLEGFSVRAGLGWGQLTILAESEFLGQAAQIVRLRFPDTSVWSLPIAAHEFGHFAAARVMIDDREEEYFGYRHPVQEILRRAFEEDPIKWFHTHEYFADMFAAYTVGPAYAYTCALLRFDPAAATSANGLHPNPAQRMATIIATLREVDSRAPGETGYSRVLDDIEKRWSAARAEAGNDRPLGKASRDQAAAMFEELFEPLDEHLSPIRYASLLPANEVAAKLDPGAQQNGRRKGSIADVLNAAWLSRLRHEADPGALAAISERALEMCRSGE